MSANSSLVMIERPSASGTHHRAPRTAARAQVRPGREPPDDPLRGDHDDAVVVAIGDHQVARQGPSLPDWRGPQTDQDRISSRSASDAAGRSSRCATPASWIGSMPPGRIRPRARPAAPTDRPASSSGRLDHDGHEHCQKDCCDHPDCTPGSDGVLPERVRPRLGVSESFLGALLSREVSGVSPRAYRQLTLCLAIASTGREE